MRKSYVYRPGHPAANENGFVDKEELYTMMDDMRGGFGNEPVSVHVITDTMEPTRHMADGKLYTSKHKFRAATKAHGCIEVGNDAAAQPRARKYIAPDRRQRREDIKRAIYELRNGRNIMQELRRDMKR